MPPSPMYTVASSKEELEASREIVLHEYEKFGYINAESSPIAKGLSPYVLAPGAGTFVAKINGQIFGTISLIVDSKIGVPMDDLYKKEIDVFRAQGKLVAEAGYFALNKEIFEKNYAGEKKPNILTLFPPLFGLLFHYATYKNVDILCITINPKHDHFYSTLLFENFAEEKSYSTVNGAIAVPKMLDIKKLKEKLSTGKTKIALFEWIAANKPDYSIFANLK